MPSECERALKEGTLMATPEGLGCATKPVECVEKRGATKYCCADTLQAEPVQYIHPSHLNTNLAIIQK